MIKYGFEGMHFGVARPERISDPAQDCRCLDDLVRYLGDRHGPKTLTWLFEDVADYSPVRGEILRYVCEVVGKFVNKQYIFEDEPVL